MVRRWSYNDENFSNDLLTVLVNLNPYNANLNVPDNDVSMFLKAMDFLGHLGIRTLRT